MTRRSWIAAALVLPALAGCGGFGGDEVTQRVTEPGLVTARDLDKQPAGSPQRTVLEWWRALQFKNPIEAAQYYTASQHMTAERLAKYIKQAEVILASRPRLVDVSESGDKAIVRLLLEKTSKYPNGRVEKERKAQAFNLVRENGSWKLSDNMYLGAIYAQYLEFTAPLRRQQKQQEEQQQQQSGSGG